MDTKRFLDGCRREWRAFGDDRALSDAMHPVDRRLAGLPHEIEGMATENKLMLLNRAVAGLGPDEVYVEVGCWRGLTVVGALSGHESAQAYTCDNFSQFAGQKQLLLDNLAKFTRIGQVQFFDMDFRAFLRAAPWAPRKVGVFFYDGSHDFASQFDALEAILPSMADSGIVIIDDTNDVEVRAANRLFMRYYPVFEQLINVRTPENGWTTWWNGVQAFCYRGMSPAVVVSAHGRRMRKVHKMFWARIVPPLRTVRHIVRRVASGVPGVRRARDAMRMTSRLWRGARFLG